LVLWVMSSLKYSASPQAAAVVSPVGDPLHEPSEVLRQEPAPSARLRVAPNRIVDKRDVVRGCEKVRRK
jgi:hypothetical protein